MKFNTKRKTKMGYQFIHVESYARSGAKTKDGSTKKTIREITDEVERVPGNFPHIEKPEPPKIIYGCAPGEIEQLAEDWASKSTDAQGRKIRKDALILLAGTASLPRAEEENFEEFTKATVAYLQEKYGDRLKSVVTHNDESHPHLHFYVLPRIGEKFEDIHTGFKASKIAKTEGKLKGEQNQEYKKAMRDFQDEFSKKVAMFFGLTRLGPGKRRLTRKAWIAEQTQSKFFANSKEVAKKGYRDGFKKGQKQAISESQKIGEKWGGVLAGVLSGLHKPTTKALEEIQQLKNDVEKQAKKHYQEQKQAEKKTNAEKATIAEKLARKTREVVNLEADLKTSQEATKKAYEVAKWYEKQYGKPTNLTKPK